MTQHTMKHGDWARIVETRQIKKQVQPKRSTNNKFVIISLLIGFFVIAALWVYALDNTQEHQISALKKVQKERITRHFSKQFMMGSWQLYDAKFSKLDINVLIKMPTNLAMNEQQITTYIKDSICPSLGNQIWHDVNYYNLYINLFVDSPRKGIYTKCQNPNLSL
ncbi:hypothetical protein PSECIP111951_04015 [Pseudoalteromonas holothuriae]|uniref:Uncharacterized protein n=1 Tax=Pseudoalteromonas holothuriae TaxID=2963714 RepID=A0A9W4R1F8_9GAMM|nr:MULTISPECIES: hypothetical protein [unclassified Pseudoalteromonas]CAH9062617.1 hypothetical protein PSECIP111854_03049 [Pseudoalteromonas sp. CIP111854]CAH9068097.1 hypothetical protein PSECIP111951_04015 [Pseudoalteromonas sp. CIP111951]